MSDTKYSNQNSPTPLRSSVRSIHISSAIVPHLNLLFVRVLNSVSLNDALVKATPAGLLPITKHSPRVFGRSGEVLKVIGAQYASDRGPNLPAEVWSRSDGRRRLYHDSSSQS